MSTLISGNIKDLGITDISGAVIRFWLRNTGGNQPRVNGAALIAPSQGGVFYFDVTSDASGNISDTLYSTRDAAGTGNGDIEVGGSLTAAWYGMQAIVGGKTGPEVPVHARSGVTLDLTNVTPISTTPVVAAPTGDTTYGRLDGGNQPFTLLLTKKLNNVLFADQYAGADFGTKLAAALADVPSTGAIVDARGFQGAQGCTQNPFTGITNPFVLLLGDATITTTKTWYLAASNQSIVGNGASVILLAPATTVSPVNANDRVILLDWNEPIVPVARLISAAIAIGATSFTASSAGDTSDLVAGDWLHIVETDPGVVDAVTFDIVQVQSVAGGTTVNVQRPFRTAFLKNHSPNTLNFYRLQVAPPENQGIYGCYVKCAHTGDIIAGIDVHRVRNATVRDCIAEIAHGPSLYTYRSQGAKFVNNKAKVTSSSQVNNSEFGNCVDLLVEGNHFFSEGTNTGVAGVLLDYALGHFQFVNNHIGNSANFGIEVLDGVKHGIIANNKIDFVTGSTPAGIILRGCLNNIIANNRLIGAAGTSTGIDVGSSTDATVPITSTGNLVANNYVTNFTNGYDVALAGDILVHSSQFTILEKAAPSSPASGQGYVWEDSTDHRLHDKNPSGVIGTTVVADAGASNNFLTAVSAAGVISKSQPAATNLSDYATGTWTPSPTNVVTTGNGATYAGVYTQIGREVFFTIIVTLGAAAATAAFTANSSFLTLPSSPARQSVASAITDAVTKTKSCLLDTTGRCYVDTVSLDRATENKYIISGQYDLT